MVNENLEEINKKLEKLKEGMSKRDFIGIREFDELYHYQEYLKKKKKALELWKK